jgi:hypothetical protein
MLDDSAAVCCVQIKLSSSTATTAWEGNQIVSIHPYVSRITRSLVPASGAKEIKKTCQKKEKKKGSRSSLWGRVTCAAIHSFPAPSLAHAPPISH